MRIVVSIALVLGLMLPSAYAASQGEAAAERSVQEPANGEPARAKRLDTLFARLKRESDPDAAKRTADGIWSIWRESGSPTIDLLMQWSDKAVADKHYSTALDLIDQVTVLEPDYAEGWNRRATIHFIMKDYAKSMSDIDKTLALEPRHFGALSGMATILKSVGKDNLALQALERLLAIYPADRQAQERLGNLADDLAGQGI